MISLFSALVLNVPAASLLAPCQLQIHKEHSPLYYLGY